MVPLAPVSSVASAVNKSLRWEYHTSSLYLLSLTVKFKMLKCIVTKKNPLQLRKGDKKPALLLGK